MLQSYSAVYCGDQQWSYFRTTLQLVQPNPNSLVLLSNSFAQHSLEWRQAREPADTNFNLSSPQLQPPGQAAMNNSRVPQLIPAKSSLPTRKLICQRQRQLLPDNSPHKLGKIGPKCQGQ